MGTNTTAAEEIAEKRLGESIGHLASIPTMALTEEQLEQLREHRAGLEDLHDGVGR